LKFDVLQFYCVPRMSLCVKFVILILPISKEWLYNRLKMRWANSTIYQPVDVCSTSARLSVNTLVKSANGFGHQGAQWRY